MDKISSQSSPKLELIPKMRASFDEAVAQELSVKFHEMLKVEHPLLTQAFANKDWKKLAFETEKLLSAALYFNVPSLQGILKLLMKAALDQTANQLILNKVVQEINKII
jgi:hypothetical protein